MTVGLYLQSETLWFLPGIDQTLLDPQALDTNPYYTLASDKTKLPPRRFGRGDGYFANEDPPVIVPCAIVSLEAALRLYARDRRKRIGSCAMRLICYVEEYIDCHGYLGERRLPEPLQRFYEELKEGEKPVRQWTMELEDALGVRHDGAGDQAAPFGERG